MTYARRVKPDNQMALPSGFLKRGIEPAARFYQQLVTSLGRAAPRVVSRTRLAHARRREPSRLNLSSGRAPARALKPSSA